MPAAVCYCSCVGTQRLATGGPGFGFQTVAVRVLCSVWQPVQHSLVAAIGVRQASRLSKCIVSPALRSRLECDGTLWSQDLAGPAARD